METGSLASRSSVAFIRRRRHIQQEIQNTLQKLELHSKVMELRHALRALESKNTEVDPGHNDDAGSSRSHPNNAIPAWIEQQPQQPPMSRPTCRRRAHVTNPEPKMKPDQNQNKKSPPQTDKSSSQLPMPVRWVQLRLMISGQEPRTPIDQLTERELSLVAKVNCLHAQLRRQAQQSQSPPPGVPAAADRLIQTAASVSEGERDQAPTATETETTNRELAVVAHAAATPSNAASVGERTAQTPTTF